MSKRINQNGCWNFNLLLHLMSKKKQVTRRIVKEITINNQIGADKVTKLIIENVVQKNCVDAEIVEENQVAVEFVTNFKQITGEVVKDNKAIEEVPTDYTRGLLIILMLWIKTDEKLVKRESEGCYVIEYIKSSDCWHCQRNHLCCCRNCWRQSSFYKIQ